MEKAPEIYALELPKYLEESQYEQLLSILSPDKQKRIIRLVRKEDKYRILLADILVRNILSKRCKIHPKVIRYDYNQFGKPFFQQFKSVSFNVSHAGDWVVCIFDYTPVGIDVEKVQPINLEIGKLVFSEEEYQDLQRKSEGRERLEYFYDLWTLKESYVKARGMGLSLPLNAYTIKRYSNDLIELFPNVGDQKYFFRQYDLHQEYKLSVCSTMERFANSIIRVYFPTVYQEVMTEN